MAQSPGQNKNKWLQTIVIVGPLLVLGLLIGFIISLLIHQQYIPAIVVGVITLIVLGVLIYLGYTSKWFEWIGLRGYKKIGTTTKIAPPPRQISKTEEDQPRKTLWDWLQLLIIPAVLVGATIFFNIAQTQNSMNAAIDQQHEDVLVNYEKDISDLLLNQQQQNQQQQLGTTPAGDVVRAVARARTLTALSALNLNKDSALIPNHDKERKELLVRFLYDAHLIITSHPIVDLHNANLSDVDLSGIDLTGINLSGAILTKVNLSNANLSGAYLTNEDFPNREDLTKTFLAGANLSDAHLWNADLTAVDLSGTNLTGADLSGALLCNAKGANLVDGVERLSGTRMPNCSMNALQQPPQPTCNPSLGDDSTQWQILQPDHNKRATFSTSNVPVPNIDPSRKTLQISLLGGQPFVGILANRTLPLDPNQLFHTFELCLNFYITDKAPIQALAFSMQQWADKQEWQWALQWQQISDGTTQQGTPPNWRIWTSAGLWQDTGKQQPLTPGRWHTLDFMGNIVNVNGQLQLQYGNFKFDDTLIWKNIVQVKNPNQVQSFAPVPSSGDQLVVSVGLDGNSQEDPYDVYIDNVNFKYN